MYGCTKDQAFSMCSALKLIDIYQMHAEMLLFFPTHSLKYFCHSVQNLLGNKQLYFITSFIENLSNNIPISI